VNPFLINQTGATGKESYRTVYIFIRGFTDTEVGPGTGSADREIYPLIEDFLCLEQMNPDTREL